MKVKRLVLFLVLFISSVSYAGFDFFLNDLSGKKHNLSDYQGKWVLINFWATWCPPCLTEMPELSRLHDENPDIVVLGINFWEEDLTKVRKFVDDLLLEFPVLILPKPEQIKGLGKIANLPTSILVSPTGKVVGALAGIVDTKVLKKTIAEYEN